MGGWGEDSILNVGSKIGQQGSACIRHVWQAGIKVSAQKLVGLPVKPRQSPPPHPPSPLHFTNKPRRSTASFTTQARTHRLGGAACS